MKKRFTFSLLFLQWLLFTGILYDILFGWNLLIPGHPMYRAELARIGLIGFALMSMLNAVLPKRYLPHLDKAVMAFTVVTLVAAVVVSFWYLREWMMIAK